MVLSAATISFSEVTRQLFTGFGTTCLLFILTLVLSVPLGLIVCFGSMSKFKPLQYLSKLIVWIIRGTPLMLQIIVVFYVPGLLFDYPMQSRFTAVLVAFVINYACYFSEIYRGGIQSIPRGQTEAAAVFVPQMLVSLIGKGNTLGGADIKLSTALAFLLGWQRGLAALMAGLLAAVIVMAIVQKLNRKKRRQPFALIPFLASAAMVVFFV